MKEYKVVNAENSEKAEAIMNQYALEGWEVKAVTYWQKVTYRLVITFERER